MARQFDLKAILFPIGDIVRRLKDRRAVLMEEIDALDATLTRFNGAKRRGRKPSSPDDATAEAPKRKGKRTRRDRASIEAEAQQIVEFIKAAGKDGVGAKDIKGRFHIPAPSVKGYLKTYAPASKVKTVGHKSTMRYFV